MDNMPSLADISAVTNGGGFGGGSIWLIAIIILIMMAGGRGYGYGAGDFGNFATAASQSEILFGQQFSNLDNKIDRIGNGIADLGYANSQLINGAQNALGAAIASEGRATAEKLCQINTSIHAEGEATRAMLQQNKIEALQAQVNQLQLSQALCGVPKISNTAWGVTPIYNQSCGCPCNGTVFA